MSHLPSKYSPELPPDPEMGDHLYVEVVFRVRNARDYGQRNHQSEEDLRDRRILEA
jgi:hypothetical protein